MPINGMSNRLYQPQLDAARGCSSFGMAGGASRVPAASPCRVGSLAASAPDEDASLPPTTGGIVNRPRSTLDCAQPPPDARFAAERLRATVFFRASKPCRGARPGFCGRRVICCSEVPIRGSHTCKPHTQLAAIAVRVSTQVRRLRWPALVRLLAGALNPDPRRLGAAERTDPSARDVQLP